MVGAFTQGAFRGSQAILGVAFVQNLYGNAGLVPVSYTHLSYVVTEVSHEHDFIMDSDRNEYWI